MAHWVKAAASLVQSYSSRDPQGRAGSWKLPSDLHTYMGLFNEQMQT